MGVLVASWLCVSVHAQFLDLDPMPEAPTFESSQLLQREAEHLRSEIDLLQSHQTQDEVIATISSALKTYRRIAFALIAQARVKPDAHHAALAGLLLASECDDIDRTLVLLGENPSRTMGDVELEPAQVARLLALLDRFSAQPLEILNAADVTNSDELDAILLFIIDPLLQVLEVLENASIVDPWIPDQSESAPPLDRLNATLQKTNDASLKERGTKILTQINPLLQFADLRAQAEAEGGRLADALVLSQALEEANWLAEPKAELIRARLYRSVDRWIDSTTRLQSHAELEHLAAIAQLIAATNELDNADPSSRAMRRSIDDVVSDDVELQRPARLHARTRRILRAIDAIEFATIVRTLERQPPQRHLRSARRALDTDYKRSEREFFDRLPELVGTKDALIDPDLAGLVARQSELAEDLLLLRQSQQWSDLVQTTSPDSLKRFDAVVQNYAQHLSQPARRPNAAKQLDKMASHFEQAIQHPFIQRLQTTDEAAIRLTGGRDRELARVFREVCAELIDDWSRNSSDREGILRFEIMIQLLNKLETLSELVDAGGSEQLSRWGGWLLHPSSGQIDPMLIASRLKIAIESFLRNDLEETVRQLDQLDQTAPLALLATRIGAELGSPLLKLPESTGARIARIASVPGPQDALIAYRGDLLKLARFSWELHEARTDQRLEDAEAIRAYCAAFAEQLLMDFQDD